MIVIQNILKEPGLYIGYAGVFLISVSSWVMQHMNTAVGICAGILGLIISTLIVVEKIRRNKILSVELKIKQKELDDLNKK